MSEALVRLAPAGRVRAPWLGWRPQRLEPGQVFKGDYLVADLKQARLLGSKGLGFKRVNVIQVKEVVKAEALTFPLKVAQEELLLYLSFLLLFLAALLLILKELHQPSLVFLPQEFFLFFLKVI